MKKKNLPRTILSLLLLSLLLAALPLPQKMRVQALDLGNIAKIVDIPDPHLHAALSEACGKKHSASHPYPLTNKDLAKLTGSLDLDGRNIKNLEGIQYCINVHSISAGNNPLSNFPDMKNMEELIKLHLSYCQLAEIPAALSKIPNLESLNLHHNQIKDLGNLKGCSKLYSLNMAHNLVASIPTGLGLSSLSDVHLSNNNLTSFPEALLEYKQLFQIDLTKNKLKSLPDALGKMPKLKELGVSYNQLTSLPASLGSSNLEYVNATGNQLTSLPDSLFQSKTLREISLAFNRLTELPETIANSQCYQIDLELNYLDISQGSKTLQLINKMSAYLKNFDKQLTPIRNLKAAPGKDQIKLTWDPCQDVTGDASVSHYEVFLKENNKLTSLGKITNTASPSFIDTGLAPGTKRDYSIAVFYEVKSYGSSSHYRSISAEIKKEETTTTTKPETTTSTSADSSAASTWEGKTTSPSTSEMDSFISAVESGETEQTRTETEKSENSDNQDKVQDQSYLKWILIGLGLAVLLLGSLQVWLLITLKRKKE